MNALHEQFVAEARELIHQASNDLIAVEREGASTERIDRILRAFHTLKGAAGVVELPAMASTLHAAEDLLAAIHAGRLVITSGMVDQALSCLDQISRWVDGFETHGTVPMEAGEKSRAMVAEFQELLSGNAVERRSDPNARSPGAVGDVLPQWVSRLLQGARANIARHLNEQPGDLIAISYEPRSGCFFDGDDPVALIRAVPNLLAFHIEAREPAPELADFDPYACNLRLQAIVGGSRTELSTIFRLVSDQVLTIGVPTEAVPVPAQAKMDDASELVRAILKEQRLVLAASPPGDDMTGRLGAVGRTAANALRHYGRVDLVPLIEGAAASDMTDGAALASALDAALALVGPEISTTNAGGAETDRAPDAETGSAPAAARLLRVDEKRIDALLNLASDLVVAKNNYADLAKKMEAEFGGHELARAVKRENETIERLSGEIHASILQLRMVPVAQVFRSFPRLVRGSAQRLGKKVELVTSGETMELDKSIADRLFEPLLHLLRNALDHGIEGLTERRAVGKAETATITMAASRVGDRFVLEVSDDGRGIDPEIVRRKAGERRIVPADDLRAMPDDQLLNLIFAAGFSTAGEVSDLSGRGVGMDVVRTTIEQLGGRVSVSSAIGTGTTIRLDLPSSIAMTRIMVVEAAGQTFGIPMDAVMETVRLPADRVSRIKGNEGFVLRDRVVPIRSLAELMDLPMSRAPPSSVRLLVVIEVGGKVAAVEVEAIRDRLDVVLKPLQGLLSDARGYTGTTLLGDGKVLLVLDIKGILP